jgi:hypothetical protein
MPAHCSEECCNTVLEYNQNMSYKCVRRKTFVVVLGDVIIAPVCPNPRYIEGPIIIIIIIIFIRL